MSEPTKDELINMIVYINQKVSDLTINDKKTVLRMIVQSGLDDDKIHTKANGTQIKFKDMSYDVIINIYNYIFNKDAEKIAKLNNFTEENIEV